MYLVCFTRQENKPLFVFFEDYGSTASLAFDEKNIIPAGSFGKSLNSVAKKSSLYNIEAVFMFIIEGIVFIQLSNLRLPTYGILAQLTCLSQLPVIFQSAALFEKGLALSKLNFTQ